MEEYFDQMQMQVSDMNMIANYSKIDAAEDFTIPKEALDAEEITPDDEGDTDAANSFESDLDNAAEDGAES